MWGVLADVLGRRLREQRDRLHLSFALADVERLERLLQSAGFREVREMRETRSGSFDDVAAYWAPIGVSARKRRSGDRRKDCAGVVARP